MSWVTNIQWHGTDACIDFICPACGHQSHIDGMLPGGEIVCESCHAVFELPTDVAVKRRRTDLAGTSW